MVKNKQDVLKDKTTQENPAIDLKPIQALKGFDFPESSALVCDMETGICGPATQEKEKK